jgi:hypothetical protein
MGSPFPGLVAAFSGLVGTPPGGIDKGRNRAREYAEYSQKIKRPYKKIISYPISVDILPFSCYTRITNHI